MRDYDTDVESMAKDILKGLKEYANLASSDVKEAVKETAKKIKKDTSKIAKEKFNGKDYAKSWQVTKRKETSNSLEAVVHSKLYPLTHLLEEGHNLVGHKPEKKQLERRDGNGTLVQGVQHIKTARDEGEKYLEMLLKKALEK